MIQADLYIYKYKKEKEEVKEGSSANRKGGKEGKRKDSKRYEMSENYI